MTIKELPKQKCTGCQLCYNICPKQAIEMRPDEDGFLFPIINNNCINCGLCAQKCPQINNIRSIEDGNIAYVIQCKDEIRNKCSSGGVFKAIADHFLAHGGIVCGATFNESQEHLYHMAIERAEDLDKILCSKYLQSDIGLIYKKVKSELNNNREVLFCGCPCQVDGLKSFLGMKYDNLVTVDLLCHGVPSPLAYRNFLSTINPNKKPIKRVNFRSKDRGWGTLIKVEFSDGTIHYDAPNGNYMRAFLSGMNMRESCYTCPYANQKRVGDITLGDFWGSPARFNDGRGTSVALAHTPSGVRALEAIKRDCLIYETISYDYVVDICKKTNGALIQSTPKHEMRKVFFHHIKYDNFNRTINYADKSLMDVGILGWWIYTANSNYGSTLTAYALERYCASLGLSTAFISPPGFDRKHAGSFNLRYKYRMTMMYPPEEMWRNNQYFKAYIVGSDVLWYYDAMLQSAGYCFMLNFASEEIRKISYSTSFGNPKYFFPPEAIPYAKSLLHRFNAVSSREIEGVRILKDKFDVNATQVVDPVFLCDVSVWEQLERNAERKPQGEYIFAYFLDPNQDKIVAFNSLAKMLNCKQICATDRQYKPKEKAEMLRNSGFMENMSIEEMIYSLKNAKFVMTDSFHGTCFSLIFRKDFYAFPNYQRDTTRFDTLSQIFDVGNRMIGDINNLVRQGFPSLSIDYSDIDQRICYHTERSKKWLNNALKNL